MKHSVAILLLAVACSAGAQEADSVDITHQVPVLGQAHCTENGPQAMINVELLGTDSLLEVVAHEITHVNQFRKAGCPKRVSRAQSIEWEAQAYCVMRPIRLRRTREHPFAADVTYLLYLRATFRADSTELEYLARRYRAYCP